RGRDAPGAAAAAAARGGGRGALAADPRHGAAAGGAGAGAVGERGGARGGPHLPRAPGGRHPRGGPAGLRRGQETVGGGRGGQSHRLPPLPRRRSHVGPHGGGGRRRPGGDGLHLGALLSVGPEVLLLFARCAHPPPPCGPPTTLMLRSREVGCSWGPPQNLSGVVGGEVFAPGPGSGIQKQRPPFGGRLVFCGHCTLERDGVSMLLSDEGGVSWRMGGVLPAIPFGAPRHPRDFTTDECQPYELPDGSLGVSIRNQDSFRCRCRMLARSWDGGATLPPAAVTFDPALPDPAVAAGVLVSGGVVFFSNPAHERERVNLTLRWSFDGGATWWGRGLRLWEGPSGYSALAAPPPGEEDPSPLLYVIYEKGRSLSTESVSLATISLAGGP
ncbi:sialidase-1, partial [Pipra filicauda]|uniref:Sialidase-1 n=1 Tax=Pipra filicauda TaxID=649802 RepID=A0A7R5KE74_9PASS